MFFTQNDTDAGYDCQDSNQAQECCQVDQKNTPCSNGDLEICKKQLEEAQQKSADWERKYLLALADYDNFKRRSAKDSESMRFQAQARILGEMLTVLDNFDRAFEVVAPENSTQFAGFDLIRKDVAKKLNDLGVQEMDNYASFNPEFHEALVQVPADETHQVGSIAQVLQKGYLFKGTVLRHAKVSVVA